MVFRPDPKSEPKKKKTGGTGEFKIFQEIAMERELVCQITREPIPNPSPSNFAHILNKNKYPHFRLYKPNIWLINTDIHYSIDFQAYKIDWEAQGYVNWKLMEVVLIEFYTEKYGLVK